MNRLQRYYFYVGTPIVLAGLILLYFFAEVKSTVQGNPHPQINYIIFFLIAAGAVQSMMHVHRINREGAWLNHCINELESTTPNPDFTLRLREGRVPKHDVNDVLELLILVRQGPISVVQQTALESEIDHFRARQGRRLLLSQYMSGMMVGMGLVGTFVGLLGALTEIAKLIGAFSVGAGVTDPVAMVSDLVARLTEPMKAMGVAFSASLFGVMGSLIMGVLLVFIKGATSELVSIVQSRASWVIDIHRADAEQLEQTQALAEALSELAEQSPLLKGLAVALDQSERRVRQLLVQTKELCARVDAKDQKAEYLLATLQQHMAEQKRGQQLYVQLHDDGVRALQVQKRQAELTAQSLSLITQQQQQDQMRGQRHEQHMKDLHTLLNSWAHGGANQLELMKTMGKQWDRLLELQTQLAQALPEALQGQVDQQLALDEMRAVMQDITRSLQEDGRARIELMQHFKTYSNEQHDRLEQIYHALARHPTDASSSRVNG